MENDRWNQIFSKIRKKMMGNNSISNLALSIAENLAYDFYMMGEPPFQNIKFQNDEIYLEHHEKGTKLCQIRVYSHGYEMKKWDAQGNLIHSIRDDIENYQNSYDRNEKLLLRTWFNQQMTKEGCEIKDTEDGPVISLHGGRQQIKKLVDLLDDKPEVHKIGEEQFAFTVKDYQAINLLEELYGYDVDLNPELIESIYDDETAETVLDTEIDANRIIEEYGNQKSTTSKKV